MANIIDQSAIVKNSTIGEDTRVWKCTRIEDSSLSEECSVGDESIIVKSKLGDKCEIGRRNIISIKKGTERITLMTELMMLFKNGSLTKSSSAVRNIKSPRAPPSIVAMIRDMITI